MSLFQAFLLGAIQGLTEFLPVSSSGHLILLEYFLKLPVETLKSFDIAVHFGTLLALLVYFWKDIWNLVMAFCLFIAKPFHKHQKLSDEMKHHQKMLGYLLLATIPAIILGVTMGDYLDEKFRNPTSVAMLIIFVGVLFFVAEYIFARIKTGEIRLREGFLMGLAQCLALVPGVSRSGITISAGLVQGVKRDEAAKFSFLLGAIAIFGAVVFAIIEIKKGKYALPATDVLITGILSSFVVGLGAISFLMKYLKKHTLHIFGIYRVILGLVVLYVLNFR